MGKKVDRCISFEVTQEELVARISTRLICPKDQTVYNQKQKPPQVAGRCDKCGTPLEQRLDDDPERVKQRFIVYAQQTTPVKAYYRDRNLLYVLNGMGNPDHIYAEIKRALGLG
jgi:adenylate kinase